jgi:peptide/nickel transport system permease protein
MEPSTEEFKKSAWLRSWSAIGSFAREKPLGAAGGLIFLLMLVVAVTAQWIAPFDPISNDIPDRFASPSFQHLMGTDHLGRDVLSRIIFGARISALVGVLATAIGVTLGSVIGLSSGYLGKRVDMYVQRVMDMMMSFPSLILAMAIMAAIGPSVINVIFAIALPTIPRANRVVRSVAISVKEFQYVEAAQAIGGSQWRIIFHHILPNCTAAFLILATSMLGTAILIEASLSFLGLGIPPPAPSWGRSLSDASAYLYQAPWLAIFPGVAISLIVFAANMFGDALRDIWDPRLKRL